ncbi:MAG TPA: ABC transporter ATP-binding protein [Solirubrobacteraceae bacterium]|nr:ABC transporter ATP-binding protein [Solirubrobacteraceae bacterium]
MNEQSPVHMIHTRGLTKRYGARTAVDGVDLTVPRACAYGFLGHNGAGKTTVIRMLLGLTEADAGTMMISGRPVPEQRADVLARVGAIVEEPSFHKYLTGRENLQVAAAVRGPQAMARIGSTLDQVGLADRAKDRVGTYSQGMRQRLGVARCLLADPELLILDEPMNGLDPGGILELRQMIRGLVDEGRTVFLSSHLLDEVEKTCDAAAVIDHGRIVEAGPIGSLLRRAGTTELAIGCDEPGRASQLLSDYPAVAAVTQAADALRVTLAADDAAAEINALLVHAGIAVSRLEPVRQSLEQRFLELTSSLGGQS